MGISNAAKFFEPKFGMFFFVAGGFFENSRDLLLAFFTRAARKVSMIIARH